MLTPLHPFSKLNDAASRSGLGTSPRRAPGGRRLRLAGPMALVGRRRHRPAPPRPPRPLGLSVETGSAPPRLLRRPSFHLLTSVFFEFRNFSNSCLRTLVP